MKTLTFKKLCKLIFINYCETIDLKEDLEQLQAIKRFKKCTNMEELVDVFNYVGSDNPCEDITRIIAEYWEMPIHTLNLY